MARSVQNPVLHAGPMPEGGAPVPSHDSAPHVAPQVQTPSQALTAAANEIIRVTDARGRVIGFRKLGILEKKRMYQALGAEDSKNDAVVLGFALPAYMAVEIDGNQLPPLGFAQASQIALDGRIALLDQEGIDAILGYFADAAAPDQGQDVKN